MNKVKIVHILHAVGGVDVSLRLILENIDSTIFENVVIHGKDDTKASFVDNLGNPVRNFKLPIQRNVNIVKDYTVIVRTLRILKKETPNLIHAHSAKGGVIGKLAGKLLGIPVLHTPQAYSYLSVTGRRKSYFKIIEKMLKALKNNKILASSDSEKNRAINEIGYPIHRALLFNNSIVPINEIKPLSIKKTWSDNYICSVGRPSYQKNIELMLDVLAYIKKSNNDIHLVLMGVGYHAPNLQQVNTKIKDLQLEDNITLLEWTKRQDIFNIIKHSKLYLTTARYEGLPYSVIESLALGKPIVATNADGNRDLVVDGYNGHLIFNESVSELANSVIEIINSKEKSKTFSTNSLKMFNDKFDITKNINNLQQIYLNNKN